MRRRIPTSVLAGGILAAALLAHPLLAQTARVIPSTPSCRSCTIEVRRVATLGDVSDPASPDNFHVDVSRDTQGRWYVGPMNDLAFIAVYDSVGRYLKRLGRDGNGPGEYVYVVVVHPGPGDSIYVLDNGSRRLTVLSPDHEVVRTAQLRGDLYDGFPVSDGRFVAMGSTVGRREVGPPIHILSPGGEILRSFALDSTARFNEAQARLRRIAPARAGGVWSGRLDRYEVERFTLEGERFVHLRRDASWFPRWADYRIVSSEVARPKPMLQAIWEDEQGRLWTITRVAAEDWRATREDTGGETSMPSVEVEHRNMDSMIEVIDVERGQLIASVRVPTLIEGAAEPGLLFSLREMPDGDIRVDIWQVSLVTTR